MIFQRFLGVMDRIIFNFTAVSVNNIAYEEHRSKNRNFREK